MNGKKAGLDELVIQFQSSWAKQQAKLYAKIIRMTTLRVIVAYEKEINKTNHKTALKTAAQFCPISPSSIEREVSECESMISLVKTYIPDQLCNCITLDNFENLFPQSVSD